MSRFLPSGLELGSVEARRQGLDGLELTTIQRAVSTGDEKLLHQLGGFNRVNADLADARARVDGGAPPPLSLRNTGVLRYEGAKPLCCPVQSSSFR